jgi:hypothetical protein
MTDMGALSNNARGKSLGQIRNDVDSLDHVYDSIGRAFYRDAKMGIYAMPHIEKKDSLSAVKRGSRPVTTSTNSWPSSRTTRNGKFMARPWKSAVTGE